MNDKNARAVKAFYFVPLGRERGGYLDILGLPPDADSVQVGEKHRAYLKDAEKVFKDGRKVLKEQLKDDQITQQEFEAKVAQLDSERTKKEQLLNELKDKYDITVASGKRGAKGASKQSDAIWLEMIRRFDAAQDFWQLLARPRPFPNVPHSLLLEIERHWIVPNLGGGGGASAVRPKRAAPAPQMNLPSQSARAARDVGLKLLAALATERDLICRLAADALWSKVRHTNRGHWNDVIERWAAEVAELGPRLQPQAREEYPPAYPNLSRPTSLAIEKLQAEDMVEFEHAPKRGIPQRRDEDLDALLAALLAQEQSRAAAAGDDGGDAQAGDRIVLESDQLQDLLRLLGQTGTAESVDVPTLAGTTWEVTDSDGDVGVFEFYADGEFVFTNENGYRGGGSWSQQGNYVVLNYPSGGSRREGTIYGDTMQGTGVTTSYDYTWTAYRLAN